MDNLGLWYQEAVINGVAMPRRRKGPDTSQRRWDILIKPLMSGGWWSEAGAGGRGRRFIELGSNAGFYLRKAKELGYEAIGVENHPLYVAQAQYWETQEPVGAKTVACDLDKYDLPVVHTVLLANLIYNITPEQVTNLLRKLNVHAIQVIVIGRHKPLKSHKSPCDKKSIQGYFKEWLPINGGDDGKHFSVLFINPKLIEVDIEDIHIFDYKQPHILELKRSFWKFIQEVDSGKTNLKETDYYRYLRNTGNNWGRRRKLVKRYIELFHSIKREGLLRPLLVETARNKLVLIDGFHRYMIAKYLNQRRVICINYRNYHHIRSRQWGHYSKLLKEYA